MQRVPGIKIETIGAAFENQSRVVGQARSKPQQRATVDQAEKHIPMQEPGECCDGEVGLVKIRHSVGQHSDLR